MATNDGKDVYRAMVYSVREKRDALGPDSPLGEAVTNELLQRVEERIEQTEVQDLTYGYWPFVFGLFDSLSEQRLNALDTALRLVLDKSDSSKKKELLSFLSARERDKTGPWYGGLFDVWAKSTAIKAWTGLPPVRRAISIASSKCLVASSSRSRRRVSQASPQLNGPSMTMKRIPPVTR